jgi:hypothetical protein
MMGPAVHCMSTNCLDLNRSCWIIQTLVQTNESGAKALKHGMWILRFDICLQITIQSPFPAFILGLANSNKCYLISPSIGVKRLKFQQVLLIRTILIS